MLLEKHAPAYLTNWGAAYCGDSLDLLAALPDSSVNLVLTSPPFALQREKEYGNKAQAEYMAWLAQFARLVHRKLKDDGSFVLDLGGAYERGSTRSHNFASRARDELAFPCRGFSCLKPSKSHQLNGSKVMVGKERSTPFGGSAKPAGPRPTCPRCSPNIATG